MGKKDQRTQEGLYGELANTARDLNIEGKGYRTQAADYYKSVAAGGPNAQRVLAPAIGQVRNQYRIARESVDRFMPRGGARMGAYRTLAGSEAGDVGRLFSDNLNSAIQNLGNLGVFSTQAGIGATEGAGDRFGQLASTKRANFMSGLGTVGKMAGMGMGV